MAGLRPGFGLGGMTHSLLVMLNVLGCDVDAGEAVEGDAMLFIGADVMITGGWFAVLRRIVTGSAVEHEDVGVDTFDGEGAEVGVDAEPGESKLTDVVMASVLNGAASILPELGPPS